MCVDGRSKDCKKYDLIINCPGGEYGLYAMLLVAMKNLAWEDGVQIRERMMQNRVLYAHSDTHAAHHHGEWFHCGCGHINLLMKQADYDLQDNLKALESLYPSEPDVLDGDHKEAAIIISKMNEDGQFITLRSNNNQEYVWIDADEQVFLYDEDAIKTLIDVISLRIISDYELLLDNQTLADERKKQLDAHTGLTVTKYLKPAVALVEKGELYHLILVWSNPELKKIA